MKLRYIISFGLVLVLGAGCESTLDVKIPQGSYTSENMFETVDGAQTAMRGIYESMTTAGFSGKVNPLAGAFSGMLGLASDELIRNSYNDVQQQFFDNNILQTNGTNAGIWASTYNYIYQANMFYENLSRSASVKQDIKEELLGEARFIRGMSYFYLVNLYNKIPLAVTSDYETNRTLRTSTPDEVYAQIIDDLKYAQSKMTRTKFVAAGNRIRANRWAATAFLAKVYLFRGDWINAEAAASEVIANTAYKLDLLENVFLSTSGEAVWQLANVGSNLYSSEAGSIGGSAATNSQFRLSPYVVSLFQTGDQRVAKWIRQGTGTGAGSWAPFKFKTFSNTAAGAKKELSTPIRLAELYLIRAEARAMQPGKIADAVNDVDEIRKRAGAVGDDDVLKGNDKIPFKTIAYAMPSITAAELVQVIYEERLRELFAEHGHRWFDAKRSGKPLVEFFGSRKPNITEADAYFPIPENDIKFNPNLEPNAN